MIRNPFYFVLWIFEYLLAVFRFRTGGETVSLGEAQ